LLHQKSFIDIALSALEYLVFLGGILPDTLMDDGLDYRYSFSVRIKVTKLPEIGSCFEIIKN
jgi:hypothetical protein